MLPLAVVLAYGCGMAEHLQLPDRRHGIGIEPQTDVSDDRIVGYEGCEMLRTAVGLVDQVLHLHRIRIQVGIDASRFAAAYASAGGAVGLHVRSDLLTDVALGDPRHDLRRRDVSLYPLDAHVFGDDGLHLGEETDRDALVVRRVLAPLPHIVDARAGHYEQGVELQHVRTVCGIVEHLAEALEIVLRIGSGKTGHDVVADLQAPVPAVLGASAHLGGAVTPLDALQDVVVEDLHPQLHPGRSEAHRALDLLRGEHVGTGLDGHPDASPRCGAVPVLSLLQGIRIDPVQSVEASLDEPFLVSRIAAGERAAHDDQVDLVGVVPYLLQLGHAVGDLLPWIEPVPGCPAGGGLLPRIGLGGIVGDASGTVRALAVGAVVRRGHHRHGGHAADGAGRLLDQKWEQKVPVGGIHSRQDIGVGRDPVQSVPLAKLQLEILQGIPVLHGTGFDRGDEVRGQEIGLISHTEPCRRTSSWVPRARRRSAPWPRYRSS